MDLKRLKERTVLLVALTAFCWFSTFSHCRAEGKKENQSSFELSGSFRLRFEELDYYSIKQYGTGTHDGLLLWRTRVNARFKNGNNSSFLQLQDNRFTRSLLSVNDFPTCCPYQNFLDIRQAYYERKVDNKGGWSFRIGRQAIFYRDNRIFGPGDWGNTGRYTWDGLKLSKQIGSFDVDFLSAKRILYDPRHFDDEHYDFNMVAVYAHAGTNKQARDYFYVCKDDDEPVIGESGSGTSRRHTVGFHRRASKGLYDSSCTVALQFGDYGADSVRAYGLHLGTRVKINTIKGLHLGLDYALASGDSNPVDGKAETFDGVFGAVDKYYGRMNLFSWMNIEDLQFTVSSKPNNKWQIDTSLHWFHLNEDKDAWYYRTGKPVGRDRTGLSGDYVGRELDFLARVKMSKRFELLAGRCHFKAGTFPKNLGFDKDSDWTFLQMTYRF